MFRSFRLEPRFPDEDLEAYEVSALVNSPRRSARL